MESSANHLHPKTPRKTSVQQQAVQGSTSTAKSKPRRNPASKTNAARGQEWQGSDPVAGAEGDFDAEGRFVIPTTEVVVQSIESPDTQGGKPARKAKKKTKTPKHHGPDLAQHVSAPQDAVVSPPINPVNPINAANASPARLAYAGPTFHASPAASNLPLPKFFSKSVPNPPTQPSLQSRLDQEADAEAESESSDSSPPSSSESPPAAEPRPLLFNQKGRESSPLDIFFNAAKAEKEKQLLVQPQTEQHPQPTSPPPVMQTQMQMQMQTQTQTQTQIQPPQPAQANQHWASIYGVQNKHHSRTFSSGSGKDVFVMEMDSTVHEAGARPSPSPQSRAVGSRAITAPAVPQSVPAKMPYHATGTTNLARSSELYNNSAPALAELAADNQASLSTGSPSHHAHTVPRLPRSAESTPQPGDLHYGNRNLNHLFQAARKENGVGPSHLRREVHNSGGANAAPRRRQENAFSQKPPQPIELEAQPRVRILKRGESPPSFAHTSSAPANIQHMENDLKRILNLSVLSSPNVG
jgi:hypothetical protein